jgi:hypothetical protein
MLIKPVRISPTGSPWVGRSFTEGKAYLATPGPGALLAITDNLGRERFILLDGPCPHLTDGGAPFHKLVGKWVAA